MIDSYFQDVFFVKQTNLEYNASPLCKCCRGYSRMTIRGEHNIHRIPSEIETQTIKDKLLCDSYSPAYIAKNKSSYAQRFCCLIRHCTHILFLYPQNNFGEPYNYHYWTCSTGLLRNNFSLLPRYMPRSRQWQQLLASNNRPVIYFPLQYFPEATVDYWCTTTDNLDYNNIVFKYISKLSEDFLVLVKEHPAVVGYRPPGFYSKLTRLMNNNIIVCPTEVTSNYCLQNCDAVFIMTGSVGIEAALRGIPVLTCDSPYFRFGSYFLKISLDTSNDYINEYLSNRVNSDILPSDQSSFVKNLLSGLIKVRLFFDGSYNYSNPNHVMHSKYLGAWIADYIGADVA